MSYKVEITEKRDRIVQLEASKLSIKDFFNDLLNETKGLKYQNTVKVLLKQCKLNGEIEFAPVYFYSVTKTVIYYRYILKILFKKFYIWLMLGLIMDLVEMLNQLSLNTLIFQLVDHYQEVFISTYLLN